MRRLLSGVTALAVAATLMLVTAPAEAATRYVVTATASTAKLDVGQSFTLRGKVTPRAKGQRVLVQRLSGSTWTTIMRPRLNRYSKYVATVKLTAPGDNRYRVVKSRSNGHAKGVSPVKVVTAWRWRSVASLPRAEATEHTTFPASGILLDNVYTPFIKQGGTGSTGNAKFRLDGKCTVFETVVGVTSDSLVVLDEATVAVLGYYIGSPESAETIALVNGRRKVDEPLFIRRGATTMTNVAVLWLQGAGLAADNYLGWGNSRVYCRS